MMTNRPKFLVDVSALIALTDRDHTHYSTVTQWFDSAGMHDWGTCAFTEAGFLRATTKMKTGPRTIEEATELLHRLSRHPGYRFWPMTAEWSVLAAPFRERLFGHQQITDAYLLGLAVKENGILVTLDRGLSYLAGAQYSGNLLVLE